MKAEDFNPVQKTLLVQALQAVCDRHMKQGNDTFIIDLLLAPKETQETIVRELANVAIGSLAQNIQQMQAVAAMTPVTIPPMVPIGKAAETPTAEALPPAAPPPAEAPPADMPTAEVPPAEAPSRE